MDREHKLGWDKAKNIFGKHAITVGNTNENKFLSAPNEFIEQLAIYKFTGKMIRKGKVLDSNCGEGLSTWILAKECGQTMGIDTREKLITQAKNNWSDPIIEFSTTELQNIQQKFNAIVQFNTKNLDEQFIKNATTRLTENGMVLLSFKTNNFNEQKITEIINKYFHNILLFYSTNGNIQLSSSKATNYIIVLCCNKK